MRNKEYPTVGTVPKEYPGPPGVGLTRQSQNLIKKNRRKRQIQYLPFKYTTSDFLGLVQALQSNVVRSN